MVSDTNHSINARLRRSRSRPTRFADHWMVMTCLILWLVVWNIFFTFLYILGMSPSQLTHLFQRGRSTTNQHLNADASTYRIFGIHKLLHTEAFTQRRFFIETPLRADSFYTEKLTHTHTKAFRHRSFYTQNVLIHRCFDTDKSSDAQKLFHREAFHTNICKHRSFTRKHIYTQKLLHEEAFTQFSLLVKRRRSQTLLHFTMLADTLVQQNLRLRKDQTHELRPARLVGPTSILKVKSQKLSEVCLLTTGAVSIDVTPRPGFTRDEKHLSPRWSFWDEVYL